MKLTSEMLRQLVESELAKSASLDKSSQAKEVSPGEEGRHLSNKVDHYKRVSGENKKVKKSKASLKKESRLSTLDYVKALELEEKRLYRRLAQISEQRTRIIEGISNSN